MKRGGEIWLRCLISINPYPPFLALKIVEKIFSTKFMEVHKKFGGALHRTTKKIGRESQTNS
jgi:hypothetical protein